LKKVKFYPPREAHGDGRRGSGGGGEEISGEGVFDAGKKGKAALKGKSEGTVFSWGTSADTNGS